MKARVAGTQRSTGRGVEGARLEGAGRPEQDECEERHKTVTSSAVRSRQLKCSSAVCPLHLPQCSFIHSHIRGHKNTLTTLRLTQAEAHTPTG